MSLQRSATPRLTVVLGIAFLGLAPLTTPALAQTDRATYDPLNAFVGTWAARAPGEHTPFLVLKLRESNGVLRGTMSHFKMGIAGNGTITGSPSMGESPLVDLTVGDGDLSFVWSGDLPLRGDQAKFVVEGTKKAYVVIVASSPDQFQKIIADNPGASGFNPVIYLSRETETDNEKQTEKAPEKWEVRAMAGLINTAEAQYRFAHATYADYSTLFRSGQLEATGGREFTLLPRNLHSETDPLPGYRIHLLVSQPGTSYQLSIQARTADCGTGLFSDETGVIFEGHVLDPRQNKCNTDRPEN